MTDSHKGKRMSTRFTVTSVKSLLLGVAFLAATTTGSARDIHVSPVGDDEAPGTMTKPLKTVAKAVSLLKAGDRCVIGAGTYHESIALKGLKGAPDAPIVIMARPGAKVVLDGTMAINAEWLPHEGNIWKTTLTEDIWQLFLDDWIMTAARWPDAHWGEARIFNMPASCRHLEARSTLGHMYDENPRLVEHDSDDEGAEYGQKIDESVNQVTLAETNIDFTGAVAVLHIGSWLSYAADVTKHEAGSDNFRYDATFSKMDSEHARNAFKREGFFEKKNIRTGQGYYSLEGLMCLDQPQEWWYEPFSKTLYFHAPDGQNPNGKNISGKIATYVLEAKDSAHVQLIGVDFFGATLNYSNCTDMLVEDCDFRFPSYNRFVLDDLSPPQITSITVKDEATPARNTIRNCSFAYMDGPAIKITGADNVIENCLFHDVDYTCIGGAADGTLNIASTRGILFRNNTVHTGGNSSGIRCGAAANMTDNHIYRLSLLQHDGSGINVGLKQIPGTTLSGNWVHDIHKTGLRFDSVGVGTLTPAWEENGAMIGNVLWRTGGMYPKGDRHTVKNNVVFDSQVDIRVPYDIGKGSWNRLSVTKNNIAAFIEGAALENRWPVPGDCSNNWKGDVADVLRDPDNLDFRPKPDSAIIGAGDDGKDIGAYQSDESRYRIPGRKEAKASTPVPPDGATNVKADAQLMWLEGYQAKAHDVYFGADHDRVAGASKASVEYIGRSGRNAYSPAKLDPEKVYYWRIDAVTDGETVRGDVWSFGGETKKKKRNVTPPPAKRFAGDKIEDVPADISSLSPAGRKAVEYEYNRLFVIIQRWIVRLDDELSNSKLEVNTRELYTTRRDQIRKDCVDFALKAAMGKLSRADGKAAKKIAKALRAQ